MINTLCEKVISASGFVFCGPEYNGGSAPILTNAITWISVTTDYWRDAFSDKIALIATHSGGNGNSFLSTFRQQLEFMGVVVHPKSIIVNKNKEFNLESSKKIIERFQILF
jgi:NAD(P)H-dependent FMN reductase